MSTHLLKNADGSFTVKRLYVLVPGAMDRQTAMLVQTSAGVWKRYLYLRDHLGSVVGLLDAETGAVVESYEYEPYGLAKVYDHDGKEVAGRRSLLGNRHLFTGREWEAEGGFYHYRHRVYSPEEKRFLQRDPIGLAGGSWSEYAYCGGNPVMYKDALGLYSYFGKSRSFGA